MMSIEQAIKQKKFSSAYHKLGVNLIYTSNWWVHKQLEALRDYDISLQQYNVLRILRGASPNPMRVNDISERMLDKTSNTSRLVDKLLAKNYLTRQTCGDDRRAVNVIISDEGLKLLAELDPVLKQLEECFHMISPEKAEEISNLLDSFRMSYSQ